MAPHIRFAILLTVVFLAAGATVWLLTAGQAAGLSGQWLLIIAAGAVALRLGLSVISARK